VPALDTVCFQHILTAVPIRDRLRQPRFPTLADEAVVSLMVAADCVDQAVSPIWDRHGLTADQYNVLRILRGVHPGGHPRNEVARRMIHRAPDVTRMLDRLVRQRLVRRGRNPADRRESIATITSAGLALLSRMDPEVHAAQIAVTRVLAPRDLRELVRLCDALVPAESS
jgi:DNA-binding MarR family transcriptional regulator